MAGLDDEPKHTTQLNEKVSNQNHSIGGNYQMTQTMDHSPGGRIINKNAQHKCG